MKPYGFLSLVAVLALAAAGVQAQKMPGGPGQPPMFDQMDKKIDEALKSKGAERRAYMREHMGMMRDQMQAMRGMMGGGGQRPGAGNMKPGQMGQGQMKPGQMGQGRMGPGGGQMAEHMQNRMDMIQRMMEQMQKQHEMMLEDDS